MSVLLDRPCGRGLALLRVLRGLSQRDLAEALGMSNGFLAHIESARRPLPEHWVCTFARVLNVSEDVVRYARGETVASEDAVHQKIIEMFRGEARGKPTSYSLVTPRKRSAKAPR